MAEPLTIVLADDHPVVRHGLRTLLEAAGGLTVLAEVADGLAVVETVERHRPDILILDVMLPGLNGLKILPRIRSAAPATQTIMLSMYSSEAYITEALRGGAMGYVLKSASADLLVEAVRTVAGGRRYLSPPFSERAIELYAQRTNAGSLDVYDTLTRREVEIFGWMAQGYKNAEISARLSISPRTVEVHRARIMQKLDLSSQRELIRFALDRGLLARDEQDRDTVLP
ncbi:MAG TPA: response regulator transcription factor [Chthonomonadaceae bacterium]|nr:response regulator transcription factor [Chthonomonadaceae bacterium]